MRVRFFQRRAAGAQISIERLFQQVRDALPEEVDADVHICPHVSRGLIPRVRNVLDARRAAGADICHVTGDVQYLAMGLPRRRTVLTVHDCAVLHRLHGWRRQVLRWLWFELPMRAATVVTTISGATREDLGRWVSPGARKKIRVIPNCVGPEFRRSVREFPAACPVFLQVGTGANKNLERVAGALAGIRCRLEIVGQISPAQRTALEASGVTFEVLGRVSDEGLVAAYQRCDALLFPSLIEGFGLPVVEAQACGRPVLTSRTSSLPEVAGAGALLVDPGDVASIRAGVERLIREPGLRSALVQAGLENVKRFESAAIAGQYAAIYQELETGTA